MSTEVTPGLARVEDIFKLLIWDTLITAGLAAFFAANPFFAFLKGPISFIANRLGDWLFTQIRLVVDLSAIRIIDNEANEQFKKASVVLAVIAHDKGIDSNEFKNARENAKDALSKFVRFNF